MRSRSVLFAIAIVPGAVSAQQWNHNQQAVATAIEELSASTVPGGDGPEGYASMLADDFTRWTLGGDRMSDRDSWVRGIEEWWEDGWRVVEREGEIVDITMTGDMAFVRRTAYERFAGPTGEPGDLTGAALAEVWVRRDGVWRLWRVDITLLGAE